MTYKRHTVNFNEFVSESIEEANLSDGALNEKKADGTISDDEEQREEDLMANVDSVIDDLIILIKKEANEIGGSFRSPGIESRVAKLIKTKLQKARL
jgi:hypothetical protein